QRAVDSGRHGERTGGERGEELVVERQVESAHAGVALTPRTAAQLVVDPTAVVTGRADDAQAAGGAHGRGVLGAALDPLGADLGGFVAAGVDAVGGDLVGGQVDRVAAQQD